MSERDAKMTEVLERVAGALRANEGVASRAEVAGSRRSFPPNGARELCARQRDRVNFINKSCVLGPALLAHAYSRTVYGSLLPNGLKLH